MKLKITSVILACGLLAGCAAKTATVTVPTASSLDLNFARALLDTQAAITTATGLVATTPSIKAPLNQVIAAYNTTESAYLVYHAAVAAGGVPDPTALTAQITALTSNVAALVTLFGVK